MADCFSGNVVSRVELLLGSVGPVVFLHARPCQFGRLAIRLLTLIQDGEDGGENCTSLDDAMATGFPVTAA